jgi:hypothetical protein
MIEAVENHMPEVIVIDEIGTELEAAAARTIAERGVQLIGTAHGNNLDNLMLNPTLSDLIGGIQSVTLGDEEARRRRTQKSVLERKAPPTFDVVVEIQDRDRVTVHPDVGETVDALLRGEPLAPELRYRDDSGVHRTQSRPRPGPQSQIPGERFGGLVGQGAQGWRVEPGWRPDARRGDAGYREAERGARPGYRAGQSGGWRSSRGRASRSSSGTESRETWEPDPAAEGFQAGGIADRGPLERGTILPLEPRAREARESERQQAWRASAMRAIEELRQGDTDDEAAPSDGSPLDGGAADDAQLPGAQPRDPLDDPAAFARALDESEDEAVIALPGEMGVTRLETLQVLPFGVSRKRLEQAIRELQLPVVVVRDIDEAEVVITLRNQYRQKAPALREAEERGLPIFVLKSNTILQMEACLTSIFALEVDPNEAALREVEEAIGLVRQEARAVELSPQNAYIRRLQHQAAERANLVSQSKGREPYRRVRVYPDKQRAWR